MTEQVPVLVVTGPVGVGKTTVASEISEQLAAAGEPHAFVDVDALRWSYPSPPGDRFRVALAMRNLAAVWANFRAEGARRLVLADVVESRDELGRFDEAVPDAQVQVVRLTAGSKLLVARVRQRELGSGREWHARRAIELAEIMERNRVEDLLVATDDRPVTEIAREILRRSGWPTVPSAG
jgi:hypothetical protein